MDLSAPGSHHQVRAQLRSCCVVILSYCRCFRGRPLVLQVCSTRYRIQSVMARSLFWWIPIIFGTVCVVLLLLHLSSSAEGQVRRFNQWGSLISPTEKFQEEEECDIKVSSNGSLVGLISLLDQWKNSRLPSCRSKEKLFRSLFHFEPRYGYTPLGASMRTRVKEWLGGRDDLLSQTRNQTVIYIMNRWTYSATMFNILRSKRPRKTVSSSGMTEKQYVDKVSKEQEKKCDFCDLSKTAYDAFGRIHGNYSYTAANVFKLEEWHSLVIFKNHHPTDWKYHVLYDSFVTSKKWFQIIYAKNPHSVYPMIFWDLLGKSGASQPHPHYHPFIARDGYYGYFKKWQDVADDFSKRLSRNYFTDLIETHMDLGLAVRWGDAVAITALNPKKDYEYVIIAPDINKNLIDLVYFIAKAYFDDLEHYSMSAGFVFPPLDRKVQGLPAIVRIMNRGAVTSTQSDTTSMELFATSLVETDPYISIRLLKTSIQKRSKEVELQPLQSKLST